MDIAVRDSQVVPGELGVFATRDIPKNTNLGQYKGIEMNTEEFVAKFVKPKLYNGYVIQIGVDRYIDGAPPHGNWTSRINANYKTTRTTNVNLTNRGNIVTKRKIKEGEELLFAYGTTYWKFYKKAKRENWLTV